MTTALPPKADIRQGLLDSPLSARNGQYGELSIGHLTHISLDFQLIHYLSWRMACQVLVASELTERRRHDRL